jgi:hypothetical protein
MSSKLSYTIFIVCAFTATLAQAQTNPLPFATRAYLDVNNIKAGHMVHGDMWWNPATGSPDVEYPKGSGKNASFASALWMSGYDNGGSLHVSAQTYRQDGNDYWPGPIDGAQAVAYNTSKDWAKIWKIERTDLQVFFTTSPHTTANTPAAILEWPAKGNPYAKGYGNATLTINTDMAPFIDVNNDGTYNPLQGDYPDMKGDQMLWWVFNDMGVTHTQTNTSPLGIDVKTIAYAYKRNTHIDNVLFYEYNITNHTTVNYSNFRLGLFSDVDLGYAFNDYIGFDSARRLGIAYNGTATDGNGQGSSYGNMLPICGVQLLETPGDAGTVYEPAGSFMYFNNDFSGMGNPSGGVEFNNYLNATFRNGNHLRVSCGPDSGQLTNYAFPANFNDPASECSCHNVPNDRRFVITTNGYQLHAGGTAKVAMAFIVTDLDTNHTCDSGSFYDMGVLADSTWNWYHTPPSTGIAQVSTEKKILKVYPNPAQQTVFVETAAGGSGSIQVFDALGKMYQLPLTQKNNTTIELDIRPLAPGVYTVLYRNGAQQQSGIFVKE